MVALLYCDFMFRF